MTVNQLIALYPNIKERLLFGRFITNEAIKDTFKNRLETKLFTVGYSYEKRPIYAVKYGTGSKKVLIWSQMHGNESTTTKALIDCFNLFEANNEFGNTILNSCTLYIIPILNPDGAQKYTRFNANSVDLNRDAQDLSQAESKALNKVFSSFKPDFCFNLHGQRTIFGVGGNGKSASMSFLSPAQDEKRSITSNRRVAMSIISKINQTLQTLLPGHIGRYDDGFNINCVGDTFQSYGVPTVLFEAGHFDGDYEREVIRKFVFIAILEGLKAISNNHLSIDPQEYFDIPENRKSFYDIIIRNVRTGSGNSSSDIAIQYQEQLKNDSIIFIPRIVKIENLDKFYGHREIDAMGKEVKTDQKTALKVNSEIDFVLINNDKIALKPQNISL